MRESYGFRGKRLFLAIDLPEYVIDSLQHLREPLKGFHWVPDHRFHLTLKFIGDVPGQFQQVIEDAINQFAVGTFFLPVEGVGKFPDRGKSHAVWAGVSNGHPRLFQLQKRIDDALFNIGIEPLRHRYSPHITLARVSNAAPETIRQYLKRHESFESPPFRVEQFHLYRSEEVRGERIYEIERSWDLRSEHRMAVGAP